MNTLFFVDDDLLPQVLGGTLPGEREPIVFVTSKPNLARSLKRRGWPAIAGQLGSTRLYHRAGLDDATRLVLDLTDAGSIRTVLDQVHGRVADAPIVVVLKEGTAMSEEEIAANFPGVKTLRLRGLFQENILVELDYAATRRLVRSYQDNFAAAGRVLILLHDDPDPDSLASAVALRTVLGRNRQTAVIGSFSPVARPENLRMTELLSIQVEPLSGEEIGGFDRIAVVDTQPHYWGSRFTDVDLVIDHHPPQKGYTTRFRDIRPNIGSTSTILLEHLLASGDPVSGRMATGMLYALKTDTLFLQRGVHSADLRAFAFLYERADLGLLRKIEGGGMTMERLEFIEKVRQQHFFEDGFLYSHLGEIPRDDIAPALADFFLQLDDVRWCAISGEVGDQVTLSLRNVGNQKPAGEVVKAVFGDIGNAGGHRFAAKAIIPREKFRNVFGPPDRNGRVAAAVYRKLRDAIRNGRDRSGRDEEGR